MALYQGIFNYHGELHNYFRTTTTARRAFFYMTRKLAQELKVTHSRIKYYFGGMKSNYEIKEVIK